MTLDEALAEFANTRSSELGDAIAALGREAIEGFVPPAPKKNMEFHQAWKQLAQEPAKRSWCLDTIIDRLPKLSDGAEESYGDKSDAVVERLDVLAAVPPDPRIVRAMLALYELRASVMGVVDAEQALVRCLIAHADDRTQSEPLIAKLAADEEYVGLFNRVVWPVPRGDVKPRTKTATAKKRDTSALFAAVYAAPDADEPREILADALQEIGDPRGEFIALQLREHRGDPSEELRDRAQALCDVSGKTWLGPLRPITYRAQMRRGFLHRLELAGSWSSDNWAELAQEPMLATVEELANGEATAKIYAAFLAGAIAATVRTVSVFDTAIWNGITTTAMPRLRHLVSGWWGRRAVPSERFKTLIVPWLLEHPQITQLTVTDAKSVAAIPAPVAKRLTDLTVFCSQTTGGKLWAAWPKLRSLTITPSEADIRFVREGKTEKAHVTLATIWGGAGPQLKLPKTIKRIELTNNIRVSKLMAKTYGKRFEVAIVKQPSGRITGVK